MTAIKKRPLAYVDDCRNLFGPLSTDCRRRLEAVLRNPTPRTWDNAYSLIVCPHKMTTLWQAWISVDDTAPRRGPCSDAKGRRIEGWEKIPDQLTLYRALRWATQTNRGIA